MQQTETYKLNKPETTDPLTPAPLNENADKLDAALARVDAAVDDLDSRVTVLEAHKVVIGSYIGTGSDQIIEVGFTPKAVLAFADEFVRGSAFVLPDVPVCYNGKTYLSVVENGFKVHEKNALNYDTARYNFAAIT